MATEKGVDLMDGGLSEFLRSFGANGPWAAVAGLLLWKILGAWSEDRKQLTELITDFKTTLDGLKVAVEHLTDRLNNERRR